jgi:hypothetical protein
MKIWKKYITAGNEKFAQSDFESAKTLYRAARNEAEALFSSWREPNEAVSALIVSYHNTADLYQRQGNTDKARSVLEKVHQLVLRAVASTSADDQRHYALYRGSITTYSALLSHQRCHLMSNVH